MAEWCPGCVQKIGKFDIAIKDVVECPSCKTQYHLGCWNEIEKCSECGYVKDIVRERARQQADAMRLAEEQARQKVERQINHLKSLGEDGYYEYKVVSVIDKGGLVDIEKLTATLNDLGLDGWRLRCAYTNEMGKDALSIVGFGINATADQNVLILERFVKFE